MRISDQVCWVLHRRPWRESSLLIELFSRDHGRLGVVARGARGVRSPWRGLVEPFSPLTADWSRRGELATLTNLEPTASRVGLTDQALWCGLYLNELVLTLVGRDDPVPALFDSYGQALKSLADPVTRALALRRFEIDLLATLGVLPDLEHEAQTGAAISENGLYHVQPETGLVAVARSGQGVVSGKAVLLLTGKIEGDRETRTQARLLTRWLIDHQLAGKVLKTRELMSAGRTRPAVEHSTSKASAPGDRQ